MLVIEPQRLLTFAEASVWTIQPLMRVGIINQLWPNDLTSMELAARNRSWTNSKTRSTKKYYTLAPQQRSTMTIEDTRAHLATPIKVKFTMSLLVECPHLQQEIFAPQKEATQREGTNTRPLKASMICRATSEEC